jgi:nitroimidazol reductase NimA-like FMN-containing flavoprotein (pyridoxamine 5'-phosphate oxidase superfamily)
MLGELNETQMNNILSSQIVGRLACSNGKQPYIVPVTFAYDGKFIYGQTDEGLKLKVLRKNPSVCFEVDLMVDIRNWQSVIIQGRFEELKEKKEKEAREILLNRVYPLMTTDSPHMYGHETKSEIDDTNRIKPIMYRIKIRKMTGRFEKE